MEKEKLTPAEIEKIKNEDANSFRNFARRSQESGDLGRIIDYITEDLKNPTELDLRIRKRTIARWAEAEKRGEIVPILSNGEINPEFIKEDKRRLDKIEAELLGINQK